MPMLMLKRPEGEMLKGALALGALLLLILVEKLFLLWLTMLVAGIAIVGIFLAMPVLLSASMPPTLSPFAVHHLVPLPPYTVWEPHWGWIGIGASLIAGGGAFVLLSRAGLSGGRPSLAPPESGDE